MKKKTATKKFPTKAAKPVAKKAPAKPAAKPMQMPQGRPDTPLAPTPEPQQPMM